MKNYKRSLKNFGKGLKATGIVVASLPLMVLPYTAPLAVLTFSKGVNSICNSLYGNYIDNSMIQVQRNRILNKLQKHPSNYIVQGLPSVKQFLEAKLTSNKMDFLKLQELNMLLQLDSKDKDGNDIKYSTTTHSGNYMLLKKLEKFGIIKNLSKTSAKMSSLKIEKSLIANSKDKNVEYKKRRKQEIKSRVASQPGIFDKMKVLKEELKMGIDKKNQMYMVNFEKSDKDFNLSSIVDFLGFVGKDGNLNEDKYYAIKNKDGKVKAIDYKKEYILGLLKQKSISKLEKLRQRSNNFRQNLRGMIDNKLPNLKSKVNIQPPTKNISTNDKNIEQERV